jgi:hypothetical protein
MGRAVLDVFLVAELAAPDPVRLLLGRVRPHAVRIDVEGHLLIALFRLAIIANIVTEGRKGAAECVCPVSLDRPRWPVVAGLGDEKPLPFMGVVAGRVSDAVVPMVLRARYYVPARSEVGELGFVLVGESFR